MAWMAPDQASCEAGSGSPKFHISDDFSFDRIRTVMISSRKTRSMAMEKDGSMSTSKGLSSLLHNLLESGITLDDGKERITIAAAKGKKGSRGVTFFSLKT